MPLIVRSRPSPIAYETEPRRKVPFKETLNGFIEAARIEKPVEQFSKPEVGKDEHPIEEWNLLYAPHLKPPIYAWHYKIDDSWGIKNFAFLQEAQQLLKQGRARVYIHSIRGEGTAVWKPVDIPDFTLTPGEKKFVKLNIYKLEQPIFTDRRPEWVWRISFWDGEKKEGSDIEMTEQEFKNIKEEEPVIKKVRVVDWVSVKQWGNAPTILVQLQTRDTPIFPELEQECIRMPGGDRDWVCREEFLGLLKLKSKELGFELTIAGKFEKEEPKVTMQPVWPPRPRGGFFGPLEDLRQRILKMQLPVLVRHRDTDATP